MIEAKGLNLTVGARNDPARSFSLADVSLSVSEGEYFVLLGKSGSGKTLLLETLCGLNRVDSGHIYVRGRDVSQLEPRFRGVGYLPQDYALFPHLTILGNVAYGLLGMGLNGPQRRARAVSLLKQFELTHLAGRYPERLSGGEKQRVALARALAIEPRVLLLDEPVSAVDEQTRDALCGHLKSFQRERGTTTIHVCHNFSEMLQVADRVAVMNQGRIVQTGTPQEILERPATLAVAKLGQPGNLFVDSVVLEHRSDGTWLRLPGGVEIATVANRGLPCNSQPAVMIREENVRVLPAEPSGHAAQASVIPAAITRMADMGALVRITAQCHKQLQLVVTQSKNEHDALSPAIGDRVWLAIAPEDVHVIPG
jgi:ABC-type Fe3+/spermidine/putrescine transport system ATPase subunit